MSVERTNNLRGLFALTVLAHHLYQQTGIFSNYRYLSILLGNIGYLSVGMFFFLSGYGLIISYQKKGVEYAKKLLIKRIIPFYLVSLSFAVVDCVLTDRSLISLIKLLYAFGKSGYLWYLEVQLIIYILFYIVYSRNWTNKLKITVFFLLVLLSICIEDYLCLGEWWIKSTACLFVGVTWAYLRNDIDSFLKKKRSLIVTIIVLFGLFIFSFLSAGKYANNTHLLSKELSAVFFVSFIVCFFKLIPFDCFIFRYLGKISLEIYAVQHLVMTFFHGQWMLPLGGYMVENPWLYCILVITCTIMISALVQPLIAKFMSLQMWNTKK